MEEFRIVLADACKIVKESSIKRVISGADEDGRVMVEFSEPVGGRRVKMLTPDEINGMLYKEETSESPANAEEAMAEETEPPTAGQEESGESALERIPKDAQTGEPQYTQTDAPTAWDAIVEQTEGDEDMARSVVDSTVRDKEAALKKLESSNPKPGATVAEKIAAAKEHKAAIEAARQELEQWKAIAEVENSRKAEAEAKAKAEEEEAKARAKAEEEEKTDESAERYPVGLDEEESSALMERMEAEAAEIPLIELNPANWVKEFGEKGIVSTPIGEVKMGENQYFKLAQRGRDGKLGMVKPTLETPDVIVEDSSKAKENGAEERPSSYVFVKTFTKADGSRYYHFTSVTVSKDGGEVVVSNQEKSENRISRLLRNGRIVWIDAAFSLHPTAQDRVSVPLGDSNRLTPTDSQSALLGVSSPEHSAGKDTEQNSDMQAEGGENASALSLIPKDANGEPVYTAADAYTAWDALVEQCGGDADMAQGVADSMVKDMETALKKAEKSAPAHGVTVAEKIAAAKGHKAAVEKARTELEKWRAIAGETASRARAAEEAERRRKKERLDAAREELRRNGRYAKEDAALGDYTDFADYAMRTIATGKYRFLWGDRESGTQGLGAHLGFTGSRTERNKRIWLLSKDGFTPEEAAERMLADYSAAAGFDSVGDTGVDSMEALDVILDVLRRYTSPRAMMDDAKAAHAENGESAEERRQGEEYERGQFMEAYHMTPEEYYEYENEWLPRYMEEAAQVPQEVIDNINAEYAEKYSENGKDDYNGGEDGRGVPPVQGERLDKPGGDEGGGDTGGAAGAVGEGDAAGGFVPQGASGREVRAGEVPQPVGKGAFGDIYDQFRGDAKAAFDFLTKHRSGDLLGVFHRDDTGDIDLVWGDENSGLSHILTKHVGKGKDFGTEQAAFDKIESILKNGKLIQDGRLRYVVSEDGYRVAIRKDYDGVKKNWIVTAVDYNRSKEEKEITTNPTSASHGANGPELAAPNNSKGKVTEESADLQENGGKDAGGKAEMPLSEQIDAASAEVNTEPTEAQKEAGNYKKGHVQVGAFDITIEQPEGSIRRGTDADGKQWESKMHNTYGYFRGTEGVDGDHIDVFLSNDMDGWNGAQVFVVDQYNPDGTFDEHKVMLGFNDASDAKNNYLANYEKGWENGRRIDVSAVNLEDFEKWIASSHRKTKPFSEYKSVKPADDSETFKGHKVENSGKDIESHIKHLEEIKDYPGADKKIVQSEIDRLKAKEEAKAKSKSEEKNGVDDAKIEAVSEALSKGDEKAEQLVQGLTSRELSKLRSKVKASPVLENEWLHRVRIRGDVSLHDWMLENQYVEPVKRVSGTFKMTDYIAPKDSPYAERIGGVYHDKSGFAVATDGRILVADKGSYDPKLKGKVIGKDGAAMENKFPDWQKVIPVEKRTKSSLIDVEDLHRFVAGVLKADKHAYISLRFPDGTTAAFNADRLNLMLRAMKRLGADKLLYAKDGTRLVAKSDKGAALLIWRVSAEDESMEEYGYAYPGNTVLYHRGEVVREMSPGERVLRDAVIDRLRESGMEVITDEEAGQRVLDEANGKAKLSAKKRRALETVTIADESTNNATAISSADGAKIQKNLETLAENYNNRSNRVKGFITDLSQTLNLEQHEASHYGTFETKDGKLVTIRVSNHNARVSLFDENGEDDGISIVISSYKNKGLLNDGDAHIVEYFYPKQLLERADSKPLSDIIKSVSDALNSGKFEDTTGLAQRQEVNGKTIREHRVYHGSGADFDRFDHSHIGEGEGNQAFGWGTYVTEVEGIGRTYAEQNAQDVSPTEEDFEMMNAAISEKVLERFGGIDTELRVDYDGDGGFNLFDVPNNKEVLVKFRKYFENHPDEFDGYIEDYDLDDEYGRRDFADAVSASMLDFARKVAEDYKDKYLPTKQRILYTVDIPDDNGRNYLDWNGHPAESLLKDVSSFLESNGFERVQDSPARYEKGESTVVLNPNATGADLYAELQEALGSDKKASQALAGLGYIGIKYPADYMRGGREDGKKNYVIFDEKDAKITDHVRFFRTAKGEAYGFTVCGKIYIDPKIANTETPIHEYAHLWAAALRGQNPKEWRNIVELMKGTSVWDEVKKRYPELNTDDGIADEVLATYSGRRGAERLREEQRKIAGDKGGVFEKAEAISALERVKQALRKFWKSVADFLHIHYKSAEEVADRVMKDLLDGVDPGKHFNSRNDDPRFMFAGEKGTARADRVMKDLFDDEGKIMRMESRDTDKEEVNIVEATHEHGFKNYADAKQWAKENIAGTYTDAETGGKGEIRISNTAIDKFLSESATAKSENRDAHMSTLRVLPDVIRESIDAEQHPDFKKGVDGKRSAENGVNSDVMIHRLYGAIRIGDDIYRVKVTLKENRRTKETTKAYSYETTKIELLAGQHGDVTMTSPRNSNNSISVANLLKGVEKSDGSGKILSEDNSEENKIIAEAKKNGRYMLAPNGKKSNLNERQWAQVRTKAFKNWFGDWESDPESSSKVVDENREPLVVDGLFLNLKESPLPKMKKAFSRAKKLAEMGRKAEKDSGYQRNSTSFAYSEEGDAFLEEYMHSSDSVQALCDCLMDGYTPKPVVAFRYGEIRENQRSYNYRDNILEKGVSVVGKVSEMNTKKSGYYDAFFGGSDYNIVIGYDINESGADGEMLLTKANVIGKAKDIARIVKSATENSGKFSNEEDDIRYRTGEKKELRDGRKIEFVRKPTATYSASARHLQAEGIKPDMHEARTGSRYMSFEKNGVQWEVRSSDHTKPEYYGEAQKPVELTYYKDKQGEENLSVSVDLGTSGYNIEDMKALMAEIDRLKNDAGEVKESFDKGVVSDEAAKRYPLLSQALGVKSENEVRAKEEAREHAEEARKQEMRSAVEDMAGKLHLNNVDIVDKPAGRGAGRRERAKGMFERSTGRITINTGNCADKRDAVVTLLHEAVAHHGLRKLFGENFETFLDNVYNSANAEIRRIIDKHSRRYDGDKRTATEEYMASLSERTDFENAKKSGWWQRIKDFFLKMLEKIGLKGFKGEDLSDNELRYVLWRSYENLKSGGKDTVFSAADDLAKQSELKVGEFAPDAKKTAPEENAEEVNERFNNELTRYQSGDMDKNEMLHLGKPQGVMKQFLPDLPIVVRQRILKKGSEKKHNIDVAALANMPRHLSSPIFVFQRSDNALGVLTEMQDRDGNNVCVAIELGREIQNGGEMLEVNDIRSVHGRNVADIVYPIVQNGTLKWADKEKGLAYLSSASRYVQQEIDRPDLSTAAKVVENFENPKPESENDALFRDGAAKDYEKAQARETYERRVSTGMFQSREAIQDSMLSLKVAMDAIEEATAGKAKRIEDYDGFENAYLGENRLSSVNQAESAAFAHLLIRPMMEEVNRLAPTAKDRAELIDYMFAKHGLERNAYMRQQAAEKKLAEYKKQNPGTAKTAADFIDAERDYAGLTTLTGKADVSAAEAEAQRMAAEYEKDYTFHGTWNEIYVCRKKIC